MRFIHKYAYVFIAIAAALALVPTFPRQSIAYDTSDGGQALESMPKLNRVNTDHNTSSNLQAQPEPPVPQQNTDQAHQDMMEFKRLQQQGGTPSQPEPCRTFHQEDIRPVYRHLKSVNFYLDFPRNVEYALECRGKEEDCARNSGKTSEPNRGSADKIAKYIVDETDRLKTLNSDYPSPLYPNNIYAFARPLIEQAFAPVLPHDASCHTPILTMLRPDSRFTYDQTAGAPDVLNLIIRVTLVDTTQPHVVVLTLTTIREGLPLYLQTPTFITALPLSPDDAAVRTTVQDILRSSINRSFRPQPQATE